MDWKGSNNSTGSAVDPQGPAIGVARINRGGSWITDADRFQKVVQSWGAPELKEADIGFRVVRTLNKRQRGTSVFALPPSKSPSPSETSTKTAIVAEESPTVTRE